MSNWIYTANGSYIPMANISRIKEVTGKTLKGNEYTTHTAVTHDGERYEVLRMELPATHTVIPNTDPELVVIWVVAEPKGEPNICEQAIVGWIVEGNYQEDLIGRAHPVTTEDIPSNAYWALYNKRTGMLDDPNGSYKGIQDFVAAVKEYQRNREKAAGASSFL